MNGAEKENKDLAAAGGPKATVDDSPQARMSEEGTNGENMVKPFSPTRWNGGAKMAKNLGDDEGRQGSMEDGSPQASGKEGTFMVK